MESQDLAALREFVQQFVATHPLEREITVKRPYCFTLYRRNRPVVITLCRGDKVYVFHAANQKAVRNADKHSDDSRVYIVQHGFQLVVTFRNRAVRWLPANPQTEMLALTSMQ